MIKKRDAKEFFEMIENETREQRLAREANPETKIEDKKPRNLKNRITSHKKRKIYYKKMGMSVTHN